MVLNPDCILQVEMTSRVASLVLNPDCILQVEMTSRVASLVLNPDCTLQVEMTSRVASLVLRLHHAQLCSTAAARPVLLQLQRLLRPALQGLKNTLGFNVAGLQHLQRLAAEQAGVGQHEQLLGAKRVLAEAGAGSEAGGDAGKKAKGSGAGGAGTKDVKRTGVVARGGGMSNKANGAGGAKGNVGKKAKGAPASKKHGNAT